MIEVFKIKQKYDTTIVPEISVNCSSVTRGNNYKLLNQTFTTTDGIYKFTPRIPPACMRDPACNRGPASIRSFTVFASEVSWKSINAFEARISGYCGSKITKIGLNCLGYRKKPNGHFFETRGLSFVATDTAAILS